MCIPNQSSSSSGTNAMAMIMFVSCHHRIHWHSTGAANRNRKLDCNSIIFGVKAKQINKTSTWIPGVSHPADNPRTYESVDEAAEFAGPIFMQFLWLGSVCCSLFFFFFGRIESILLIIRPNGPFSAGLQNHLLFPGQKLGFPSISLIFALLTTSRILRKVIVILLF